MPQMTPPRFARRSLVLLATLTALLALSCSDGEQMTCPEGLEPYVAFNFYFGLQTSGGEEVTDAEWQTFLAQEVTPRFPDGLTVFDAAGQWLDTDADRLYREGTKVLNILVPADSAESAKRALDEIADVYVEQFDQQVVFKTSAQSCAGF